MSINPRIFIALLLLPAALGADTLGFVEQKFTDLHFERGKWTRTAQLPCYSYAAQVDGATVEVLRFGMGNLVPFKAKQGLTVTVCGSTAAFDEGFETGTPVSARAGEKQKP
jgi:hypothetical protein